MVQFCCHILLFGRIQISLIELSDKMSPVDQIGGGNLNMVGGRVGGGMLFIDPVVLHVDPIVNYITFKESNS